jgi:hypothetical protein
MSVLKPLGSKVKSLIFSEEACSEEYMYGRVLETFGDLGLSRPPRDYRRENQCRDMSLSCTVVMHKVLDIEVGS